MDKNISTDLINWFMESTIYGGDGKYHTHTRNGYPGPVYPEITAYAISLSCVLYNRTGEQSYLERAKACARYMIKTHGLAVEDFAREGYFLFDTAILISGLFDLFSCSNDDNILSEAEEKLDWLLAQFDGEMFPSIASLTIKLRNRWDEMPSVHLAKVAIPLAKGWKMLGRQRYKQTAISLLDNMKIYQKEDGRFVINSKSDNTMLHPHCYATEGYLAAGSILQEEKYIDVARRASKWLESVQNENGSFYKWLPKQEVNLFYLKILSKVVKTQVADATSQAIRIWKVLGEYPASIERAEDFISQMTGKEGLRNHLRMIGPFHFNDERVFSWPGLFYLHSTLIEFGDFAKAYEVF